MRSQDRYDSLIQFYAQRVSLPWELVKRQVAQESAFRPDAASPSGAVGLMQLMPATAAELGCVDARNPELNLRAGSQYQAQKWADVREFLHGTPDLNPCDVYRMALASYNCGWGYVRKALQNIVQAGSIPIWSTLASELPKVEVKGRHPDSVQATHYAVTILPLSEDSQWTPLLRYPGSLG